MEGLPRELLISHVIPELQSHDLISVCKTLPQLKGLCNAETFWQTQVESRYSQFYNFKPSNKSWKVYFRDIADGYYILKPLTRKRVYHPREDIDSYIPIDTRGEAYHFIANNKKNLLY